MTGACSANGANRLRTGRNTGKLRAKLVILSHSQVEEVKREVLESALRERFAEIQREENIDIELTPTKG